MALIRTCSAGASDLLYNKYVGGDQNLSSTITAQTYTNSITVNANNCIAVAGVGTHNTITFSATGCYAQVSDDLETWSSVTSGANISAHKYVIMQNRGSSAATFTFT